MTSLSEVGEKHRYCSRIDPTQYFNARMFKYRDSSNLPTYSEREGGMRFAYQVSIEVSVNLDDARQRRLESHFNQEQGYGSCECNRNRNVVTIYHMDGIRRGDVMKYIRHKVDPNARELA